MATQKTNIFYRVDPIKGKLTADFLCHMLPLYALTTLAMTGNPCDIAIAVSRGFIHPTGTLETPQHCSISARTFDDPRRASYYFPTFTIDDFEIFFS